MSNAFACQNCLHEVDALLPACPECKSVGAIAPKTQVPFFATPHNYPKPELVYCERCDFKTIHPMTHCPNCTTTVNTILLGSNATKLLTRKQGNNSEIIIGCLILFVTAIVGALVLLVLLAELSDPSPNDDKILIGLIVTGAFMLLGLGFVVKGIIGRFIGGR